MWFKKFYFTMQIGKLKITSIGDGSTIPYFPFILPLLDADGGKKYMDSICLKSLLHIALSLISGLIKRIFHCESIGIHDMDLIFSI